MPLPSDCCPFSCKSRILSNVGESPQEPDKEIMEIKESRDCAFGPGSTKVIPDSRVLSTVQESPPIDLVKKKGLMAFSQTAGDFYSETVLTPHNVITTPSWITQSYL